VFCGLFEVANAMAIIDPLAIGFTDDRPRVRWDRVQPVWVIAITPEDARLEEFVYAFGIDADVLLEAKHRIPDDIVFEWVIALLLGIVDRLDEQQLRQ
jgi:hypothetical protein